MPDMDGRPSDSHELNQQLAATIGASVEQLLGMGGTEADNMAIEAAIIQARSGQSINAGQPGAGGGSTQGQPAGTGLPGSASGASSTQQPSPTATPSQDEIDWEATKGPNGKYFGKYDTKAEAVKGYFNVVNMSKTAFLQAETQARQNADLQRALEELRRQPVATPAPAPQNSPTSSPSRGEKVVLSSTLDTVLSKIQENGNLDAEDLASLVNGISDHSAEVARRAAQEEYDRRAGLLKAEQDRWTKVEQYMAEKYPQSVDFADELALFVKTHPMIGAGVQALIAQDRHEEAMGSAWEMYLKQEGIKPKPAPFIPAPANQENINREIRGDAADQVRREAVEEARKDAGIIGAGNSVHGVHENAQAGAGQGEYDEAVARMRQGDGTKWRALVFGADLNHPLFNS